MRFVFVNHLIDELGTTMFPLSRLYLFSVSVSCYSAVARGGAGGARAPQFFS